MRNNLAIVLLITTSISCFFAGFAVGSSIDLNVKQTEVINADHTISE